MVTLVALGSSEAVIVVAVSQVQSQVINEINTPESTTSTYDQDHLLSELKDCLPAINWGYGHSPVFKDRCYATLAVAWGPLI